ncbi:AAA family ATPase [Rahnella inusitata]|uniref:AAA family ATPase n=1 Tax=Rahnella inusitata TaxID=58169 RepID=UPI0039AF41FF
MRQPYRLESITLRDVGVFENTHFDFPPIKSAEADAEKAEIHIFTGPNGCGKSTLLYALAAVFEGKPGGAYLTGGSELLKSRLRNYSARINFSFNNQFGQLSNTDDKDLISDYYLLASADPSFREFSPMNFAAFAYSGQSNPYEKFDISTIEEITASPFENALSFNSTVRPKIVAQWIANNRTKTALANQDGELEEGKKYDIALARISQFIKTVCDLDVVLRLERSPLAVTLKIDNENVSLNVLPDGLKSIIGWISDLALRLEAIPWKESRDIFSQPIILFLDEVDIHLHPKWQRRILPAIQKLLPNAQVFVSSHSPFVVGSVEDAWVYRLPDPQRLVCRDPHIAEVITPTESSGGKSYQVILEEVFEVKEQFDIETEKQLEHFYQLRNAYLKDPQDIRALKVCAEKLSEISEEVDAIILMEMRQIARLTKAK